MGIILETDVYQTMAGNTPTSSVGDESQDEPRLEGPFPARVKGQRVSGQRFIADTVIENLSAHDFCVRLIERVEPDERLFVAARLDKSVVALRGKVLQTLLRADGMWDVTVLITRYHFVHRYRHSD
jgi:hypothetical protein